MACTRIKPHRKLLQPGWAGDLSDRELKYIREELKRSRRLRRAWGYSELMVKGITIPTPAIRKIARHGLV